MKGNLTRSERREEERIRKMNGYGGGLTERQKFVLHGYSLFTGFPLLVSMMPKVPSLIRFIFLEMGIADSAASTNSAASIDGTVLGTVLGTVVWFISTAMFYFSFSATFCFTAALIGVAMTGGKNYSDSEYKDVVKFWTTILFIITWMLALSK